MVGAGEAVGQAGAGDQGAWGQGGRGQGSRGAGGTVHEVGGQGVGIAKRYVHRQTF